MLAHLASSFHSHRVVEYKLLALKLQIFQLVLM